MLGSWVNRENKEITLILTNFPCSYNQCTHCAFDIESIDDKDEIIYTNEQIIDEARVKISEFELNRIKIFNGGSFFEMPDEIFQILHSITANKEVSIESRPEFLSKKTVKTLFEKIEPSKLNVFIGFDSADEKIRNEILNKGISQSELARVIKELKDIKDVDIYSYILFGIEGVSEESVKESINFFNENLKGVSAIEFRKNPKTNLKHETVSNKLKSFLKQNCVSVDFIGDNDDQWILQVKKY